MVFGQGKDNTIVIPIEFDYRTNEMKQQFGPNENERRKWIAKQNAFVVMSFFILYRIVVVCFQFNQSM